MEFIVNGKFITEVFSVTEIMLCVCVWERCVLGAFAG